MAAQRALAAPPKGRQPQLAAARAPAVPHLHSVLHDSVRFRRLWAALAHCRTAHARKSVFCALGALGRVRLVGKPKEGAEDARRWGWGGGRRCGARLGRTSRGRVAARRAHSTAADEQQPAGGRADEAVAAHAARLSGLGACDHPPETPASAGRRVAQSPRDDAQQAGTGNILAGLARQQ